MVPPLMADSWLDGVRNALRELIRAGRCQMHMIEKVFGLTGQVRRINYPVRSEPGIDHFVAGGIHVDDQIVLSADGFVQDALTILRRQVGHDQRGLLGDKQIYTQHIGASSKQLQVCAEKIDVLTVP